MHVRYLSTCYTAACVIGKYIISSGSYWLRTGSLKMQDWTVQYIPNNIKSEKTEM